jgi:hypothetical protein
MSFIDWSDSETMCGLLLEYVADECSEARDAARQRFLSDLRERLDVLREIDNGSADDTIDVLRDIHRSIPHEFRSDPVVEHLGACVDELERIR